MNKGTTASTLSFSALGGMYRLYIVPKKREQKKEEEEEEEAVPSVVFCVVQLSAFPLSFLPHNLRIFFVFSTISDFHFPPDLLYILHIMIISFLEL